MAGFREVLPASLAEVLQNGLLDHVFEDALVATFLYDTLADIRPWEGNLGSTAIMTRAGLLAPNTTPITGSDATASAYGFEQYTLQMNQYGDSIDTNMAVSAMALASKYIEDNKTLAIQAAQSLDLVAQSSLYTAYSGGNTFATGAQSGNDVPVADLTGFGVTVINLPTSGTNPGEGLTGVAAAEVVPVSSTNLGWFYDGSATWSYTGVQASSGPGNLTGVQASWTGTQGASIVAGLATTNGVYGGNNVVSATTSPIAPQIIRPAGVTSQYNLQSTSVATLALFRNAVARLKMQHVPQLKGAYTAHCTPQTINELFADTEFQSAYRGGAATTSPVYPDNAVGSSLGGDATFLGRLAGIDWIENTVSPIVYNTGTAGEYAGAIYRPIVVGADALIKGPFTRMGDLVAQVNAGGVSEVTMIGGVARILRAPLDRLGQVLSSTWSWIGGYTTGTDILTGDNAIYKRAVIVEHA